MLHKRISEWSFTTFRGWLIVLQTTSVPGPELMSRCIFSFLDILFPAGLTNEGKLNGTIKLNWPFWYCNLCDHLTLTDTLEPPSTYKMMPNVMVVNNWEEN